MKYEHDPRLPWRNPENAPLDKIPDGWRLMLPGDEGAPRNPCRLWFDRYFDDDVSCEGTGPNITYIIPATVPLPEEFWEVEAKPEQPVINDGGPAFPTDNERQSGPSTYHYAGMTLRDWFAGQALTGLVFHNDFGTVSDSDIAKGAYSYADAMLKQREITEGQM